MECLRVLHSPVSFVGQLCRATPCDNGGTCVETGGNRTCNCVAGYTDGNCTTGGK